MTTIPRNHTSVITALKAQYSYAVGHHKNDAYTAQAVDAASAWNALAGHRNAVLTRHDDRLKITHPLGWFDLFPDEAAYTATLSAPTARPVLVFPTSQHRAALGELRRRTPGEVGRALLREVDQVLATGTGRQAHIALLAVMAQLEQAGHPREAAAVEAIADELSAAIIASGVSQ